MGKSRPWYYHLLPLLFFAAITALWTRPLASTGIIGEHAGDNLTFVWSFWWARFSAANPDSHLFATDHLFAPIGSSLVLHTLVPAMSVWARAIPWDVVTLYNLSLVVAVFLNAACTYALAWRLTGDLLAATFAGVAFAGAPHLLVRLLGHLNVLSAWGLPLLLLAYLVFERRPSRFTAAAIGGALALLAYLDYYYAIFGGVLVIVYFVSARWSMQLTARPLTILRRRTLQVLAALLAVLVLAVLAIWASGGTELSIGGRAISVRSTFNPRAAAWLLGIAILLCWKAPRISVRRIAAPDGPQVRLLAVAAATTLVLMVPLLIAAARVIADGGYVTQRFSWRSAPGGIDLAALLLGNPLNAVTGEWTRAAYRALQIDPTEGSAWLGLAPMLLVAMAFNGLRREPEARRLLVATAVFFLWALGPYLTIAGENSALLLPQSLFKFVPILSNARIPGRALTVVLLMLALFGAMALASIDRPRRQTIALTVLLVALFDTWPRANPILVIDRPPLYTTLRALPAGIVLEVPAGTRSSFGTRGFLDHRVLLYQTVHEHPIVGGMVTRLSPRTIRAYDEDPILGPLLDLSEGKPAPGEIAPCINSLACAIRYVVIDERLAPEPLKAFVNGRFGLEELERNDARSLYRVTALKSCDCPPIQR